MFGIWNRLQFRLVESYMKARAEKCLLWPQSKFFTLLISKSLSYPFYSCQWAFSTNCWAIWHGQKSPKDSRIHEESQGENGTSFQWKHSKNGICERSNFKRKEWTRIVTNRSKCLIIIFCQNKTRLCTHKQRKMTDCNKMLKKVKPQYNGVKHLECHMISDNKFERLRHTWSVFLNKYFMFIICLSNWPIMNHTLLHPQTKSEYCKGMRAKLLFWSKFSKNHIKKILLSDFLFVFTFLCLWCHYYQFRLFCEKTLLGASVRELVSTHIWIRDACDGKAISAHGRT